MKVISGITITLCFWSVLKSDASLTSCSPHALGPASSAAEELTKQQDRAGHLITELPIRLASNEPQQKVTIRNIYNKDFPFLISLDGTHWVQKTCLAGGEIKFEKAARIRFRKSTNPNNKEEEEYVLETGARYDLAFYPKSKTWGICSVIEANGRTYYSAVRSPWVAIGENYNH